MRNFVRDKSCRLLFTSYRQRLVSVAVAAVAVTAILTVFLMHSRVTEAKRAERGSTPLQFTANGHVVKFEQNFVHIASRDHGLKVEFVGNERARITSQPSSQNQGDKGLSLGTVTYTNLWKGISLSYEATRTGVVKSTYYVGPQASVDSIKLRYNVAAEVDTNGNLVFHFPTGVMRESAPVAWQIKNDKRVPVSVNFRRLAEREVGLAVGAYDPSLPLVIDPTLQWNTFLGSDNNDFGLGIATDASGNVFVVGVSNASWGTPIRSFGVGPDAFLAKLDSNGTLLWNAFLGGSSGDEGDGVGVDASGNVYVTGFSAASWGSPINSFTGSEDAFVAKLDTNGALLWNTFLGSTGADRGNAIAVDGGNVYVGGWSDTTWGTPVNAFAGGRDAFAIKLTLNGGFVWSTFMGGPINDFGNAIAVDSDGNVLVGGESQATWGTPVQAYTARADGFAAKLNSSGQRQWNTFYGTSENDEVVYGIAVDLDGNAYITGLQNFVAKLNSSGVAQWNMPAGGLTGFAIAVDNTNNVFVAGHTATDAVTTKYNSQGVFQWQSFDGGSGMDVARGIAVRGNGNVYVAGSSNFSWGAPIRPFTTGAQTNDGFVYKLLDLPPPTLQFNSPTFSASEGPPPNGATARVASIVVTRAGDASTSAAVDFQTSDGTALQRTDYTTVSGTITFAPNETSKIFNIPLVDDGFVEDTETVNLTLSNPVGATLGATISATLSIDDDEESPATTSPLDDPAYFVRQHYFDFLNRTPDSGGFNFWVSKITSCGSNPSCIRAQRISVSNAFFFELEFQQTGAYVYRLYRAAYGNNQPFPNTRPDPNFPNEEKKLPSYQVFSRDRAKVIGGSNLAQKQLDLANLFVSRPEFSTKYPASLATADQFVDAVLANILTDLGVDLGFDRGALINLYGSGGRGAVMYRLADDNEQNPIHNRALIDAEYNRAFVATQYFGYLRRNPDIGGIIFWLGQVNSAPLRDLAKQNAMVCSFITSAEYQQRFSPVAPHSNAECPQ
jgi:hypothetical protein